MKQIKKQIELFEYSITKENMPYIYKTTFPNGKIYIGSDMTDSVKYLGSPTCMELILRDHPIFTGCCFSFQKEILIYYKTISRKQLLSIEKNYIIEYNSTNPDIGYNLV